MYVQLKSRYSNIAHNRRFMVGIDKDKMKLFNMESSKYSQKEPEPETKFKPAKAAKDFRGIKV